MATRINHAFNDGYVDIPDLLEALLESLADPKARKPTREKAKAALVHCESIATQLRALLNEPTSAADTIGLHPDPAESAEKPVATEPLPAPAEPTTAPAPAPAGEDTAGTVIPAAVSAAGRPHRRGNQKARQRQRLKKEQEQQEQHEEQEQQMQEFQQTLWSGGSQFVPMPPPTPMYMPPAVPEMDFRQAMWTGGWQLVHHGSWCPMQPTAVVTETEFQRSLWGGSWQMVARPPPTPQLRARVIRCLRVYRWQRMQDVWTGWMRGFGSSTASAREESDGDPGYAGVPPHAAGWLLLNRPLSR